MVRLVPKIQSPDMTIWQIAAGSEQREYIDHFLKRGLAFVGGAKQIATLTKVQVGDILVLKHGISKVKAIGTVVGRGGNHCGVGDKHWLKDFDGWDLEAYVYVDWRQSKEPVSLKGLTRGTISRINSEPVRTKVMGMYSTFDPITEISLFVT